MTQHDLTDEQIDEAALYAARKQVGSVTCPDCFGDGCGGRCPLCAGWGAVSASLAEHRRTVIISSASALSRAWDAAGGKDQVVS